MEEQPWQAVAALVDPVRRALYDYVRRQDHAVTREEAADAAGVSRHLAAFHLDKLVDVGLLVFRYEAPDDQPRGRGRTPKVYEPADSGLSLTVPQRRYELIAAILTEAVAEEPADAGAAARRHARAHGKRHGQSLAAVHSRPLTAMAGALATLGFEPDQDQPGRLILNNCPFHALAVNQPELICGLNHAFLDGLLRGMGCAESLSSHLVPRSGKCCVEIQDAS